MNPSNVSLTPITRNNHTICASQDKKYTRISHLCRTDLHGVDHRIVEIVTEGVREVIHLAALAAGL